MQTDAAAAVERAGAVRCSGSAALGRLVVARAAGDLRNGMPVTLQLRHADDHVTSREAAVARYCILGRSSQALKSSQTDYQT
jgi:hypothetical protein